MRRGYGACQFLESFGGGHTVYDVARAVELHDEHCGAALGLELA